MRRASLWLLLAMLTACARTRPTVVAPGPSTLERLAAADRLLRDGCLDCLVDAYREYGALRSEPSVAPQATAGALRAAALITLRERELGMADDGYLKRARDLATEGGDFAAWVQTALDVIDALPGSTAGVSRPPANDREMEKAATLRRNREAWTNTLGSFAEVDELAAYTWFNLMCGAIDARDATVSDIFRSGSTFREAPLGIFKRATCRTVDRAALEALLESNARFVEIAYLTGLAAVGRRQLDEAEKLFLRAYQWRPRWPSLTQSMGHLAMTVEEFERAALFYDETLAIEPHAVDALIGKVRAHTYQGRHQDAIDTTDRLLAERWHMGDARYWRALNEAQLERFDEAWADIEAAAKLLINGEVPKLAGIIAYRRQQIDLARSKFEESRARNPNDCETNFYLGTVFAEQAIWDRSAAVLLDTVGCLDGAERALQKEITTIRASHGPPARQARQILRREQQIANGARMRITSWFDLAVAYYNLSRPDDARQYAEKVIDDERFGGRAREILSRLR